MDSCSLSQSLQSQSTEVIPAYVHNYVLAEERANTTTRSTLAGRRRSKTESFALNEPGREPANEWIDTDNNDPARRRRYSKRRTTPSPGTQKSQNTDFDLGRFLPRLGRILESTEGSSASRSHKKAGEPRKRSDRSIHKIPRYKDDQRVFHRRPAKHRVGSLSRHNQPTLKINPSLLSVISGLTGISDSSSNTTITQQSYNSRSNNSHESNTVHRRPDPTPIASSSYLPNVFEFMDSESIDRDHDGHSESSSHYSPSDADSSEAPQTPSSNSTFPSPTATRSGSLTGSVTELRRKRHAPSASSIDSTMNSRHGSEAGSDSVEGRHRRDSATYCEDDYNAASVYPRGSHHGRRHSRAANIEEQERPQLDPSKHHLSLPHHQYGAHLVQPIYGQNRSHSTSSANSDGSHRAYAQYMAMQQYQHPSAPAHASHFPAQKDMSGSFSHPDRPPVPDAPDLSQRTVVGYEMLAQELANADSPIPPIYRKFEYPNHRILLHLQDELCEMEEQLRTTDEIIAQMDTPAENCNRLPASRRADAFAGSDMHHRRTALLGRIFLKTEQYNRAMSSYAALVKNSRPAGTEQVHTYRDWMAERTPIHEMEAKFLQNEQDLVRPGAVTSTLSNQASAPQNHPSKYAAAFSCLPVALMLPLLLYSIIPTLAGRLVITMLVGIGVFLIAATTRIRHMMPLNEWAVCGGAYVLIMAAIAGCIPQHAA